MQAVPQHPVTKPPCSFLATDGWRPVARKLGCAEPFVVSEFLEELRALQLTNRRSDFHLLDRQIS
jgi:hypothetical protein